MTFDLAELGRHYQADVFEKLSPFIHPAPSPDEYDSISNGLLEVMGAASNLSTTKWVESQFIPFVRANLKYVSKALRALEQCESSQITPILDQLKEIQLGWENHLPKKGHPVEKWRKELLRRCLIFLAKNGRRAGIGKNGSAVKLAQAAWHLGTKEHVAPEAWSQMAKRMKGKDINPSECD